MKIPEATMKYVDKKTIKKVIKVSLPYSIEGGTDRRQQLKRDG